MNKARLLFAVDMTQKDIDSLMAVRAIEYLQREFECRDYIIVNMSNSAVFMRWWSLVFSNKLAHAAAEMTNVEDTASNRGILRKYTSLERVTEFPTAEVYGLIQEELCASLQA